MEQCNTLPFSGQKIYCGFDVHSKKWQICVRSNGMQLKCAPMDADVQLVIAWLKETFPGAEIHSVYEAGFCGFSAHRALLAAGIHNIVINPADVPTTGKERVEKCDRTDCRKLARHLEAGNLTAIDVPSLAIEGLRGLVRRETQVRNQATRLANQLKGALHFHGRHAVPKILSDYALRSLEDAMALETDYAYAQEILSLVRSLRWQRDERRLLIAAERKALAELGLEESVRLLTGIRGIGFRTAVVLVSELGDITRFKTRSQLAAYVGLAPHTYGSGEDEVDRASGNRKKKQLHYLLIQAAWVAVSKDLTMCSYFGHLCQERRLKKTRAIVSVAKKMLLIVYAVLRDRKPYRPTELFEKNPKLRQLPPDGKRARDCAKAAADAVSRLVSEEDALSLPVQDL